MDTNSISPDREDRWVDLLIAIIERARRDSSKPTTPEPTRRDAHEFLQWAAELQEDY